MSSVLNDLVKKKDNVMLYFNPNDPTSFLYGNIISSDETWSILHIYTPVGRDDGLVLLRNDNISRIETDGQYKLKMEKLCSRFGQSRRDFPLCKDLLPDVLHHLMKNRILASYHTRCDENDTYGYLVEEGDHLKIKLIDEYGNNDGYAYIAVDTIEIIGFEGEKETARQYLYGKEK